VSRALYLTHLNLCKTCFKNRLAILLKRIAVCSARYCFHQHCIMILNLRNCKTFCISQFICNLICEWSIYVPLWHCAPSQPFAHVHVYPLMLSAHVPPFWQGVDAHSSISTHDKTGYKLLKHSVIKLYVTDIKQLREEIWRTHICHCYK